MNFFYSQYYELHNVKKFVMINQGESKCSIHWEKFVSLFWQKACVREEQGQKR